MSDEIKEILNKLSNRKQETLIQGIRECQLKDIEHPFITKEEYIDKILDYIIDLQEELKSANESITWWQNRFNALQKENEKLKGIAHKMHLWIFLHSEDEQKVYDELGLTDEENAMLGYSGQFRIGGGDEE